MGRNSYEVVFDVNAMAEALDAAKYIARRAPQNAKRWFAGLEKAIASLEIFPQRCGVARESTYLDRELRHYIYKSHRIIFRIEEERRIVRILHIRHSKRRAAGEGEEEIE